MYERLRGRIDEALEYGRTLSSLSALIALAGLVYWCPRCGQWMGEGSEGTGPAAPNAQASLPPRRLLRAVSEPIADRVPPTQNTVRRHGNRLTEGGILKQPGSSSGEPAKFSYDPPSSTHGRVVDGYYGGAPKPDSRPHGHDVQFIRGDGEQTHIYHRLKDGTIEFESGVDVVYRREDNSYEWTPREQ
jgi:hypothetical protein